MFRAAMDAGEAAGRVALSTQQRAAHRRFAELRQQLQSGQTSLYYVHPKTGEGKACPCAMTDAELLVVRRPERRPSTAPLSKQNSFTSYNDVSDSEGNIYGSRASRRPSDQLLQREASWNGSGNGNEDGTGGGNSSYFAIGSSSSFSSLTQFITKKKHLSAGSLQRQMSSVGTGQSSSTPVLHLSKKNSLPAKFSDGSAWSGSAECLTSTSRPKIRSEQSAPRPDAHETPFGFVDANVMAAFSMIDSRYTGGKKDQGARGNLSKHEFLCEKSGNIALKPSTPLVSTHDLFRTPVSTPSLSIIQEGKRAKLARSNTSSVPSVGINVNFVETYTQSDAVRSFSNPDGLKPVSPFDDKHQQGHQHHHIHLPGKRDLQKVQNYVRQTIRRLSRSFEY